ncbi:MAG: sigma-70 family RNA polymerase sigma factor [Gammaproteobacteria bacterium]|nr:sigma-70 family RNA polymerase sigma factor [Gammaproteobacteria bacterium]NNF62608.1 sigma-70 family RNA polymerase sigma factor [Gammaproteobacteria bacterium]NNM20510.1 sigma-70 family RNA polymerase sigma factor [Gammaproteobacteria bacterium]
MQRMILAPAAVKLVQSTKVMPVSLTHNDKLLTDRMLQGEQRAFDEFFDSNFPRLYRFTLSRIGDDEDAVKEIVQKTLCRAVARVGTYRGEAALFTWLCRLCRNEISDHYKRLGRTAAREVPFEDIEVRAALESLDHSGEDPTRAAERDQLGELIRTILDYLPARQGNALEWKYVQGLTVEEIANRMGVSHAAAQSLLARARQSFREGFRAIAHTDLELLLR